MAHFISRFLDVAGDGSGTKNMIGNYSTTATVCQLAPSATEIYNITELVIQLEDGGAINDSEYGAAGSGALTNGIELKIMNATTAIENFTDGVPVKQSMHWGRYGTLQPAQYATTTNYSKCVIDFTKYKPDPEPGIEVGLTLNGAAGHRLVVQLSDDFSALTTHYFYAKGHYVAGGS